MNIIKYNKIIQKRLNININDYINFFSIEIEVIPAKNKYGDFIFIPNKKELSYYHIYFNDSKEEIKRNYIKEEDNVIKIRIIIDYPAKSFYFLFAYCNCIESINFTKFYGKNITNMSGLFCQCTSLRKINFSNFNTENVTDMSYMFRYCSSLEELDLSNFNTKNLRDMSYMFNYFI